MLRIIATVSRAMVTITIAIVQTAESGVCEKSRYAVGIYDLAGNPCNLVIPADEGVPGPGFLHLPPDCAEPPHIAPAQMPVQAGAVITQGEINRLMMCGREFFRQNMAPTIKHV